MSKELELLDRREVLGKKFRIYGDFDNPLFLAKDVAEWIEHSNVTKMLCGIEREEKIVIKTPTNYSLEGLQSNTEYTFLTEEGLYEVLMLSRKPIAKDFKKKVKEILKEIRKTGKYETSQLKSIPQTYAQALRELADKVEENERLQLENTQKTQLIGELQPKANYLDKILQSKELLSVTQISKDYGMSAISFNKLLNEKGVQFKQSKQWFLYEKYQREGYTQSFTYEVDDKIYMTTKWTQKGRIFLYNLLKLDNILPVCERGEEEC